MADFPGAFCKQFNLTTELLKESTNLPNIGSTVPNGLVIELKSFCDKSGRTIEDLFKILCKLNVEFCASNSKAINVKITRLLDAKKKLTSKKKVPGFKNVQDLCEKGFVPPTSRTECIQNTSNQNDIDTTINKLQNLLNIETAPVQNSVPKLDRKSVSVQTTFEDSDCDVDLKDLNLKKFSYKVLEKKNNRLQRDIEGKYELIQSLESRIGHFSIRNVNKRDETAKKNLHALRNEQRTVLKQEKVLKKCTEHIESNKRTIQDLTSNNHLLTTELASVKRQLECEKQKKLSAQKTNSYLRTELQKVKKSCDEKNTNKETDLLEKIAQHEDTIKTLGLQLLERNEEIKEIQSENEMIMNTKNIIATKSDGKTYNENIRMCVIELAGLEVAVEKVSPIIQCVCLHLIGKEFKKSELPNPHTVQRIIDEGHFLAKSFIADKIDSCHNWGLSRDGTSRKKQKILDTSVTLDTGDVISLGFNRVNRETGVAINDVTKSHLNELETLHRTLHGDEEANSFVVKSLEKLSFTMSDRASNEKKADQLLDEWRDSVLCQTEEKDIVHHFHCMAHTLLAFHSYTNPGLKEMTNELGPLGRDTIPFFKCWGKKETVAERTARTVSDVFGPAGDHHGLKDRWDAYCAENGVKSCIGNYKDNRFNSIFETSAQVILHRQDFQKVLQTVEKPNMLLQSVQADLKSDVICTLLQCYGMFYVKVTGPYWNLMTSGKVHYLELSPHIVELKSFLEDCVTNPEQFMYLETHWSDTDPLELRELQHIKKYRQALSQMNDCQELLHQAIVIVAKAMISVINRQLVDFLEGGTYFGTSCDKEVKRTDFAMVTNLSCEHHFGDLDSSQKRRPNASLHHHSSVQLLKRNRTQMFKWLNQMKSDERNSHLKVARKGGQDLRNEHMAKEKQVLVEINTEMTSTKEKKRKGQKLENQQQKRKNNKESVNESEIVNNVQVHEFLENQYVAIAYQDGWYPGIVEKIKTEETAIIKFMSPCRKAGHFQWPRRDDRQLVNCKFILEQNIVPDCINSGRQWFFNNHEKLQEKFVTFQELYF